MIFNYRATKDAKTLEGHGAEYFAKTEELFGNAKSYANLDFDTLVETKMYTASGTPLALGAKNYPVNSTGLLIVEGGAVVSQKYITHDGEIYERSKLNTTGRAWSKWEKVTTLTALLAELAKYIPKTGGTFTGNVRITGSTEADSGFIVGNDNGNISLVVSSAGSVGLWASMLNKWLIYANKDGKVEVNGTATGNLSLYGGGTVNGGYTVLGINNNVSNNGVAMKFSALDETFGFFGFAGKDIPVFIPNTGSGSKALHHDGNSARVHINQTAPSDTAALWVY